jgi:hypothetical protein
MNTRAYTVGDHIVFGLGESVDPSLLRHELAHVAQQTAPVGGTTSSYAGAEAEADLASQGSRFSVMGRRPIGIACAPPKKDMLPEHSYTTGVDEARGVTFKTAEGELGVPYQVVNHRSPYQQKKVAGGTGDDAGHLIADLFGGSGKAENLTLQNWISNQYGTFKRLENEFATKLKQGVRIRVKVTDNTKIGESRPFYRHIEWTETTPEGAISERSLDFANPHTPKSRLKQNVSPTTGDGDVIYYNFKTRRRATTPAEIDEVNGISAMSPLSERPPVLEFPADTMTSFLVGTIVSAAVSTLLHWAYEWVTYDKNTGPGEEELRLRKLLQENVEPGVRKALEVRAREAEQMTNENPELPVYANVTVDLTENWDSSGAAGVESDRSIIDAGFVDLALSFKKVSREETLSHYQGGSWGVVDHYAIKRLTYPVEVDFGETSDQRKRRMHLRQAGQAVARGESARTAAGRHFDIDVSSIVDRREEERRAKYGEPSLGEQRDSEERKRWVQAYIDYTALRGPAELHADAVRYLEELNWPTDSSGRYLLKGSDSPLFPVAHDAIRTGFWSSPWK